MKLKIFALMIVLHHLTRASELKLEVPEKAQPYSENWFRQTIDSDKSHRLPSLWGGGEFTGVITLVPFDTDQVRQVLAKDGLKLPKNYRLSAYPVFVMFGAQTGVRPLEHSFYNSYMSAADKKNVRLNYNEMAFFIPDAIFDHPETHEQIETSYLAKVFLTSKVGAEMDHSYLGYPMQSEGVRAHFESKRDGTLQFRTTVSDPEATNLIFGEFSATVKASDIKTIDKKSLDLLMGIKLDRPVVSFPLATDGRPRYSHMPDMYSAMIMDPYKIFESQPVSVDISISEQFANTLGGVKTRVPGLFLKNVPWALITHYTEAYILNSHPLVLDTINLTEELKKKFNKKQTAPTKAKNTRNQNSCKQFYSFSK